MKFWEAMKLVDEGKKVRRPMWFPEWVLYKNKDLGYLVEENTRTEYQKECFLDGYDMVASDWEVLE